MDLLLLMAVLCAAAVQDLRTSRIPNALILAGILSALVYGFVCEGYGGLLRALIGAVCTILLLYFLFALRVLGAGDVKLFGVMGAFLSVRDMVFCVAVSFLIGAAVSLVHMILNGSLVYYLHFLVHSFLSVVRKGYPGCCRPERRGGFIHFSVPVLLSFVLLCLLRWKQGAPIV